jgi:hypothetical protein
MILFGLLCGRWWRFALAAAVAGWPALLLATGVMGAEWGLLGAAALAALNAGAGVAMHQAALWAVRQARRGATETA